MTKITLNEALAQAKQKENEIYRLFQQRATIIDAPFDQTERMGKKEEYTAAEFKKHHDAFLQDKKKELATIEKQLAIKIKETITIRNKVNQANVTSGLDKKLIEMKWLRIRLDHQMKSLEHGKSIYRMLGDTGQNTLGLDAQLNELEKQKSQLDSEIQQINHTTQIEVQS
jgi:hypothetical protein